MPTLLTNARRVVRSGLSALLASVGLVALLAPPAPAATLSTIAVQSGSALQDVAVDAGGSAWVSGLSTAGNPALFEVAPGRPVVRHDLAAPGTVGAQGVVLGADGFVYACLPADDAVDRRAEVVQVSPVTGDVLQRFVVTTAGGQGDGCWDLADGPPGSGRIYFSSRSSNRVGYVAPLTGAQDRIVIPGSGPRRPLGITAGPDGRVWFTLYDADAVASVDAALGDFRRVDLTPGARPRDLTPWTDGALWVSEENGSGLTRVTTAGEVTRIALDPAVRPNRVVAAPDGTLWFSGSGSTVGRLAPGGALATYRLPDGAAPQGVAIGAGRSVWFAGSGSGALHGLPLELRPDLSEPVAVPAGGGRVTVAVDLDARGLPSSLSVDLGTSTDYGLTGAIDAGAADGTVRREVAFDGLAPGTYHFRVRSANAFGERAGADQTVVVPRPDTDGDGIPDDVDCADTDATRHQGAAEIPGNAVDEDCDGLAQRFRRLGVAIAYTFEFFADGARVKTFSILRLPARSIVRLTCRPPGARRSACPFKRHRRALVAGRRRLSLAGRFRDRHLPPGTRIELRISAPQRIGAVRRFTVRRTRVQVVRRCLVPGRSAPSRCGT